MSTKPIYIYEGGGNNPHIIAAIDTDKFSDHDSRAESAVISRKVNNISTIEVIIPANCEASKAITNTSDLVLYDTNGNLQEFHITDIDDLDEYSVTRTIYAESSFGELINSIVIDNAGMPTSTNPADYLAYILSFTRWSVGTVDTKIYNSKWDEDITGLTCLEAFQKLIDKYNCEFVIRYETDNKNKITGRYVDLKKSIGHNYGKRFEDSKDILGLKSSLDLDSIKTAIYPRIRKDFMDENGNSRTEYVDISSVVWSKAAGNPVDKPLGQTVLVNPDAETMYKRYNTKDGKLMERVMYAEWTNESAIDAEDLCSQAWAILKANGVLNPTITVSAGDLYRMSGDDPDYSHEQVDLGDTCIIIDRNFDPELRLTTRVMEMEEDILNPVNNTYVFGNYRKTLATSNIDSQKSIEEQLTDLYNKLQGVKVDYELPYQSGKKPYQEIKESVENEFMSASGYVMAEDSDGFWVLDAPVSTYSLRARTAASPTKAVILKGGMLGFAQYNPVKSKWEVGTFIDGMSVNADYINTGHLSADVISAGSITTDHLSTAAIEYIKTGMATDEDLQGVIDSVANDYATKDSVSSNISNAVKDLVSTSNMNSAISNATKDMATNSSVSSAITNATKDMATNSSVNSAINNAVADMATNSSVNSAISNATKDLADRNYVNNKVDSIEIGGRNLWIEKNLIPAYESDGNATSSTSQHKFMSTYTDLNGAKYVTVQLWNPDKLNNTSNSNRIAFYDSNKTWIGSIGTPKPNGTTYVSGIITVPTNAKYMKIGMITGVSQHESSIKIKVELGNKATDWTPAPEDVEEQARKVRLNAVKDLQKQLQTEYNENYAKANKIYTDQYLPAGSTAKVNLNNKMTAYTTAYNNYNNYITTMISDGAVTDAEYNQYNTYATAYATAVKDLAEAIEDANSARLSNVYAQARQGLVTTADLEVNNQSVIASAKAGMVSTGDMTASITAATENLVSNNALNSAIDAIKIGGTNLVKQTKKLTSKTGDVNWKVESTGTEGFNKLHLSSTSTNWVECQIPLYAEINSLTSPVTVSFEYIESTAGVLLFSFAPYNGNTRLTELANKEVSTSFTLLGTRSDWKYVSFTFDPSSLNGQAGATHYKLQFKKVSGKTGEIHVRKIKIEIGNKATEWTPAPQDTDEAIADKVTNTQMNSAINNATADMATNSSVNNAISNATADMATNTGVTNAINNIAIGGRNYIYGGRGGSNSGYFSGFSTHGDGYSEHTLSSQGTYTSVHLGYGFTLGCRDYVVGKQVTYSYDIMYTSWNFPAGANRAEFWMGQRYTGATSESSDGAWRWVTQHNLPVVGERGCKLNEWYHVSHVITIPAQAHPSIGTQDAISFYNSNSSVNASFTFRMKNVQIEYGNKATDYKSSPEDATRDSMFETYRAITVEYNNNYKIATTLYSNSYLSGTAKDNLKSAYEDYNAKYLNVQAACANYIQSCSTTNKTNWDNALTNLEASTRNLAQRVQEASTFINTAVYNASKNYTDTAIPDALTGYATTSYVNSAKADAIADAKKGMVSSSQLEVNNTEILLKTSKMGQYNLLRNSDFRSGTDYWVRYDGSKAPDAWGVVNDSDAVVIAGERCMRTWISSGNGAVVWNGFYQDVTLAANTSYTLSYWLSGFQCTSRVSVWRGTNNDNTIAYRTYSSPINGNHNRESWKYDSITFTTSTAGTYRMFFQTKDAPSSGGYGLFLIKPMLCTGINAQAWTAHPDEIHVGVVSVTEQNGIKVEHSDFNTYSVLNASGLKVLTNSNSLVASFGESGSAYIGDLTCDGYVKSPQVMPVSKKVNGGIVEVYCSETGSGNQSGNSSNYAMGWAGAMRKVLDYLGIDYTHTEGGFVINTNTSNKKNLRFRIFIKGSTFTNNIELYNIYGHATFEIRFDSGCKYTGQMRFCDLEPEIDITGSGKAVLHRGTSEDYAIYCYNVKKLYLHNIYINYTNASSYNYPIYAYNTNCHFSTVDFCNCGNMASIDNCYLEAGYCVGSMNRYIMGGYLSFINLSSNKVPAVSASAPYGSAANVSSMTSYTPTSSAQQGSQPVTINVTKTYNCSTYSSFRTATYRPGILLQGAPSAEELNKFGNYYGRIYFAKAAITEDINTITNPVVTLYLERASAISSATDYVDIYINGSYAGELQGDKSNWFTLSSTAIDSIKNNGYVEINGTGVENYTQFKTNAVLKITGTQTK